MTKRTKKSKAQKVNHHTQPLRRIVGREEQNGKWFVILECKHASPGKPKSAKYSRFYPCPTCAAQVKKLAKEVKKQLVAQPLTPMDKFRRQLRLRLKGGTF